MLVPICTFVFSVRHIFEFVKMIRMIYVLSIPSICLYSFMLKKIRKPDGQTALNDFEELTIVYSIMTCADWGSPFTLMDARFSFGMRTLKYRYISRYLLIYFYVQKIKIETFSRYLVKNYLDVLKTRSIFQNNFPGYDWGHGFLKPHPEIRKRAENMKRSQVKVSPEIMTKFFQNLQPTLN